MQHEIVMCLDPYSRQAFAMTSHTSLKRWGVPDPIDTPFLELSQHGPETYVRNLWKNTTHNKDDWSDELLLLETMLVGMAKRPGWALFIEHATALVTKDDGYDEPIATAILRASVPSLLEWAMATRPVFFCRSALWPAGKAFRAIMTSNHMHPPNPLMVPIIRKALVDDHMFDSATVNAYVLEECIKSHWTGFFNQIESVDPKFRGYVAHPGNVDTALYCILRGLWDAELTFNHVSIARNLLQILECHPVGDDVCTKLMGHFYMLLVEEDNMDHVVDAFMLVVEKLAEKKAVFRPLLVFKTNY